MGKYFFKEKERERDNGTIWNCEEGGRFFCYEDVEGGFLVYAGF